MNALASGLTSDPWGFFKDLAIPVREEKINVESFTEATPGGSYFALQAYDQTGMMFVKNEIEELVKASSAFIESSQFIDIDLEVDSAVDQLVEAAFAQKTVKRLTRRL